MEFALLKITMQVVCGKTDMHKVIWGTIRNIGKVCEHVIVWPDQSAEIRIVLH